MAVIKKFFISFFIDDFSFSKNIAKFKLIDVVGLLDKYTFYDGQVYNNVRAEVILNAIFATAGIKKYTIDDIFALPEGKRAELIDGQIYNMAPPSPFHQKLVMELSATIRNYIKKYALRVVRLQMTAGAIPSRFISQTDM